MYSTCIESLRALYILRIASFCPASVSVVLALFRQLLQVISNMPSFSYKGVHQDVREIGVFGSEQSVRNALLLFGVTSRCLCSTHSTCASHSMDVRIEILCWIEIYDCHYIVHVEATGSYVRRDQSCKFPLPKSIQRSVAVSLVFVTVDRVNGQTCSADGGMLLHFRCKFLAICPGRYKHNHPTNLGKRGGHFHHPLFLCLIGR